MPKGKHYQLCNSQHLHIKTQENIAFLRAMWSEVNSSVMCPSRVSCIRQWTSLSEINLHSEYSIEFSIIPHIVFIDII